VLLAHDDSTFLQRTPSCARYCTDQELTGTSSCLSINIYNRDAEKNQYIDKDSWCFAGLVWIVSTRYTHVQ
jgi:hypothetical protein